MNAYVTWCIYIYTCVLLHHRQNKTSKKNKKKQKNKKERKTKGREKGKERERERGGEGSKMKKQRWRESKTETRRGKKTPSVTGNEIYLCQKKMGKKRSRSEMPREWYRSVYACKKEMLKKKKEKEREREREEGGKLVNKKGQEERGKKGECNLQRLARLKQPEELIH